jgi:hypothetical protein
MTELDLKCYCTLHFQLYCLNIEKICSLLRYDNRAVFRPARQIAKSDCCLHHVHPSVGMKPLVSHWTDFHEI